MKTAYFLIISFLTSVHLSAQIEFREGSWDEILSMAQAEDKPIFVDAYAVWCGPCKRMAADVFTQASVGDFFNGNFINAKIDMEKGEGPTLRSKYGVTAYPTLLFMTPEGDVLHKAIGYQNADNLLKHGNMALRKTNQAGEFTKRYEAGEREPEFILEYIQELNKADRETEKIALEYFQEMEEVDPEYKARIAFESFKNMDSQLFKYVLEGKEVIRSQYDQSVIDHRLIEASKGTINTAIQYSAPSVFHQMVENLNSMDVSPDILSSIERSYYAQTKDEEAFLASIKTSLEDENSDPCALAMEIYQAFPESTPMLEFAKKVFDQNFPMDLTLENYVTGLSLAIGLQDMVYMGQLHATMKMKPNPSTQETRQVDGLFQKAQNYLNRQMSKN